MTTMRYDKDLNKLKFRRRRRRRRRRRKDFEEIDRRLILHRTEPHRTAVLHTQTYNAGKRSTKDTAQCSSPLLAAKEVKEQKQNKTEKSKKGGAGF